MTRLLHRPRSRAGSVGAGRVRPPRVEVAASIRLPPGRSPVATRGLHSTGAAPLARTRLDVLPRPRAMRAWGDLPGDDPDRDRAETEAEIQAAGIDLDPAPPGSHGHGDETHPSDHAHPPLHSRPSEPPVIGIVG